MVAAEEVAEDGLVEDACKFVEVDEVCAETCRSRQASNLNLQKNLDVLRVEAQILVVAEDIAGEAVDEEVVAEDETDAQCAGHSRHIYDAVLSVLVDVVDDGLVVALNWTHCVCGDNSQSLVAWSPPVTVSFRSCSCGSGGPDSHPRLSRALQG